MDRCWRPSCCSAATIHLVCLPAEADLINAEGFKVKLPVRGRSEPVLLESKKLPGKVTAGPATGVDPKQYDLVGLCMQEPQYRSDGVRQLLDSIGKSRVPCMSIMNMPPLPYIKRITAAPDVDRHEQEQPDDVDEVPVPGGRLEAEMLLRREVAAQGAHQADGQEDRADDDVEAVEAGRHEEGRAVDIAFEARTARGCTRKPGCW